MRQFSADIQVGFTVPSHFFSLCASDPKGERKSCNNKNSERELHKEQARILSFEGR